MQYKITSDMAAEVMKLIRRHDKFFTVINSCTNKKVCPIKKFKTNAIYKIQIWNQPRIVQNNLKLYNTDTKQKLLNVNTE